MPDPDTMRQMHDAADQAARGADGTVWGGVGAVLTAAGIGIVRRVRGDTWKEHLRETLRESLMESTRIEGEATRTSLEVVIKTMREEGRDTRHELNALSKEIANLAGQVSRMKG